MKPSPAAFLSNAREALQDATLQQALTRARAGFIQKRAKAVAATPEFPRLRERAVAVKADALNRLPDLLRQYEQAVCASGGQVHWAETAEQARDIVLQLCKAVGGGRVAKGKSMVGEEIELNPALEAAGHHVLETDLGEYIIQLAQEPPSHIIAPAVHKTREQVADLFAEHHSDLPEKIESIPGLVAEARRKLRRGFLDADIGITGANLLIAESGTSVLVTNEGNGDLCATLPKTHIVIAGIEKVVPDLQAATDILRVLGRSATGQDATAYTSFFTGPKRADDPDGPEQYHVVLVNNGRADIARGPYRDMLRCIRCGACLNHCPVYAGVGGHAYGAVYPGPMGSVLTPLLDGLETAKELPNACSLCGRCGEVCPVKIPLPDLLRRLRGDQHRQGLTRLRGAMGLWAWAARRPRLWRMGMRLGSLALRLFALGKRYTRALPFAKGWTAGRDLPIPDQATFLDQWKRRAKS